MTTPQMYISGFVNSRDGTRIGYRQMGDGPGLILVHGGMKSAQDFSRIGRILARTFTVYIPDRRGRGASGSHGARFCIAREVEDMQALMSVTGCRNLFGLSAGALVGLRATLECPAIEKLALYEPPLSIGHSVPMDWVARYQGELAASKYASAVVTALKGLRTEPLFSRLPRFVLVPLMAFVMKVQGAMKGRQVTIHSLVPTLGFDMHLVREMADTLNNYAHIKARVLLLGGGKSPGYFGYALERLSGILRYAERRTFAKLGHDGPEDDGHPGLVAAELREFFGAKNG